MSDIGAVVLYKVLEEKSLEGWSKLKLAFLDPSYSSLYTAINKYYAKYNCIPGFEDLEVSSRDTSLSRAVAALKELEVPEVDLDVALDALIDNYTQSETLRLLDKFIDKVTLLDSEEIKEHLSGIVMKLDEKTHTSETVIDMASISIFQEHASKEHVRFPLGLNNTFDSSLGGAYREELFLLGGKRGAGKSIVCSNLAVNQYQQGNCSVYFTIEMKAMEVMHRNMGILANVSHSNIRQDTLSIEEVQRLAKTRADMFVDAEEVYFDYLKHNNPIKFENDLIRSKLLKPTNQMVIIDDRELTITSVDLHLQKLKAKFGDKLTLAVIDYMNQIVVPGCESTMYDWTTQITVSKKLKEFARKYDIAIVSPYQIDKEGETRFARGILDAADVAMLLDAHTKEDQAITFETTKIRGGPAGAFTSGINWDTLAINPADVVVEKKTKKEPKDKQPKGGTKEEGDVPW